MLFANFCRSSGVFSSRVAEMVRMLMQAPEIKRSLDDLNDPLTLFRRPIWPRSVVDRVFKGRTL